MKIRIEYKSGYTLEQEAYYARIEDGVLYYGAKRQAHGIVTQPSEIDLAAVKTIEIK